MLLGLEDTAYLLIFYLCRHDNFRNRVLAIKEHEYCGRYGWTSLMAALEVANTSPAVNDLLNIQQVREYHDKLVRLAKDYRLPLDWGPEAVHQWGFTAAKGFVISPFHSVPFHVSEPRINQDGWVEVLIRMRPGAKWADVERELKHTRKDMITTLNRVNDRAASTEERLLRRDLMWLARRLASGERYKEIWKQYCDKYPEDLKWSKRKRERKKETKYYGEVAIPTGAEVVGSAIRKHAKMLGIDISKIRIPPP